MSIYQEDIDKYHEMLRKIQEYAKTEFVILKGDFSLDELIDSHRMQRALIKELLADQAKNWSEASRRGEEAGKLTAIQQLTHIDHIKVDDLRKMTIQELVEYLADVDRKV